MVWQQLCADYCTHCKDVTIQNEDWECPKCWERVTKAVTIEIIDIEDVE